MITLYLFYIFPICVMGSLSPISTAMISLWLIFPSNHRYQVYGLVTNNMMQSVVAKRSFLVGMSAPLGSCATTATTTGHFSPAVSHLMIQDLVLKHSIHILPSTMSLSDTGMGLSEIKHEMGYIIVKMISSILPHVDTIGHRVLHMDDQIINFFINTDNLSPEVKKQIILNIIRISQQGDNFGSQMLQLYYDIVNKMM